MKHAFNNEVVVDLLNAISSNPEGAVEFIAAVASTTEEYKELLKQIQDFPGFDHSKHTAVALLKGLYSTSKRADEVRALGTFDDLN